MNNSELDHIIRLIFEASKEVHKHLGRDLMDSVYRSVLCYELSQTGLQVSTEVPVYLSYKNKKFKEFLVGEILVNQSIFIEVISSVDNKEKHMKHLQSLMKFSRLQTGILINFNVPRIAGGFHQIKSS